MKKKMDFYRISSLSEEEIKTRLTENNDLSVVDMGVDVLGEVYHRVWDCTLHEPDGSINGNEYGIITNVGVIWMSVLKKHPEVYEDTYLCPRNLIKELFNEWINSKETKEKRRKIYKEKISSLKAEICAYERKLSHGTDKCLNSNYFKGYK